MNKKREDEIRKSRERHTSRFHVCDTPEQIELCLNCPHQHPVCATCADVIAAGRKSGIRNKKHAQRIEKVRQIIANGSNCKEVSEILGVSKNVAYKLIREAKAGGPN